MPYQDYGPFVDVHPSQTGRRPIGSLKGQDFPPSSMRGKGKSNESRWFRCYQCGFPIDEERDFSPNQEPAISFPTTLVSPGGQTARNTQDRRVGAGCPFCGAAESAQGPPR